MLFSEDFPIFEASFLPYSDSRPASDFLLLFLRFPRHTFFSPSSKLLKRWSFSLPIDEEVCFLLEVTTFLPCFLAPRASLGLVVSSPVCSDWSWAGLSPSDMRDIWTLPSLRCWLWQSLCSRLIIWTWRLNTSLLWRENRPFWQASDVLESYDLLLTDAFWEPFLFSLLWLSLRDL